MRPSTETALLPFSPPPPWAGTKGVISREASGVAPDLELWDACCEVNVYSPLRFTRDPWSWFSLFVQFIARELMFAQRFGNRSLFFLLQKLTNFEEVNNITVYFCKIVVYVKFQWMGPMCTAAAAHGPYNHSLQLIGLGWSKIRHWQNLEQILELLQKTNFALQHFGWDKLNIGDQEKYQVSRTFDIQDI